MNIGAQLFDAFFMMRPLLLLPVWGFCIFGYNRGISSICKAPFHLFWNMHALHVFFWFAVFSSSVASVYILNQIADIEVDKENNGFPLIAKGKVSIRSAWAWASIYAVIGVIAPLFHHPILSFFAGSALLLGIVYSFKPLRLSGRLCLDFFSNATGYGIIAFGAGWYLSGAFFSTASFFTFALPYFLLMCAGSISSTIPDYASDKQHGKKTTAVHLGILKAHLLAALLVILSIAASFIVKDYHALICALCAFPLYAIYFFKRDRRVLEATYKIGGAVCMLLASSIMPMLALFSIVLTIFTWIYFRKRHHVTYPSLVPVVYEE